MLGNIQQAMVRIAQALLNDNRAPRDLDGLEELPPVNAGVMGGWEGRSDDSAFKRYVVFEVGGMVEAAAFRAWALESGKEFKSLLGSWRGRHNPSFIMEDTSSVRLELAYWVKAQEALLCLGPAYRKRDDGLYQLFGNREAVLDWLEPDGYTVRQREPLKGLWQSVSKETALRQESWTFDPTERQYYAVV